MLRVVALVAMFVTAGCRREASVFYADLPDAAGVREGALVRYRGVQIGSVQRVAFVDSVVGVTIRLTRSDVPLRTGDAVRLAADGIFGDRTLDVIAGSAAAPELPRGGTLRAAPRDSAAELRREVLEATAAAALRDLGGIWHRDTRARDSAARARGRVKQ